MTIIGRLSTADLTNFGVDAADTPMNQAVLAVVDRAGLVDSEDRVDIARLRRHVEARLSRLPELRRIVYRPGLILGRPLWIDDPHFQIEYHVQLATLTGGGGELAAIDFAERQMSMPMDRSRPLWQMWFLDGYSAGGVGLLIKLHHGLADGPAMVNMLGQLLDIEPRPFEETPDGWQPEAAPSPVALLRDNLERKARWWRHASGRLMHPRVAVGTAARTLSAAVASFGSGHGAPRLFFNRPIGATRSIAAMHVSLDDAKAIAHRHEVKLNDVFLAVAMAGLRQALLDDHQSLDGLSVHTSVAVSTARSDTIGNHAGTILVSVPIDADGPDELVAGVAAATVRAKARQKAVVSTGLMAFLARTGITRLYIRHQHLVNVLTTNVPGPPVALYLAASRVRSPIALPPIAGNVSISFAALSYEHELSIGVIADRRTWPNLDSLRHAMEEAWVTLSAGSTSAPARKAPAGPSVGGRSPLQRERALAQPGPRRFDPMVRKLDRIAIVSVSAAVGLMALVPGWQIMTDGSVYGFKLPGNWLTGAWPFEGFFVAGLILLVVVGGGCLLTAGVAALNERVGWVAALVMGAVLVGWIGGELIFLSQTMVMTWIILISGLVLVALSAPYAWPQLAGALRVSYRSRTGG